MILDALLAASQCAVVGVLDDDRGKMGQKLLGVPILGPTYDFAELARKKDIDGAALAIGDNYIRDEKFRQVREAGLRPVNVIHPAARVSRFVDMGEGVVILAGAVVNPGTVIADNVCINTSASVDHDNWLGRSSHIFPNATLTGGVRVGEFSYIGSGAVVNPYLTIGRCSVVGAGAVVTRDVAEGVTVVGVPARKISRQAKRPDSGKER